MNWGYEKSSYKVTYHLSNSSWPMSSKCSLSTSAGAMLAEHCSDPTPVSLKCLSQKQTTYKLDAWVSNYHWAPSKLLEYADESWSADRIPENFRVYFVHSEVEEVHPWEIELCSIFQKMSVVLQAPYTNNPLQDPSKTDDIGLILSGPVLNFPP